MKLTLYRRQFTETVTIGSLYVDGLFCCHTLEPHAIYWKAEKKEYGKTAIPEGKYKILLSPSSRFRRMMPYLLEVPHFNGIMIHWGNFARDTQGCILVGWHLYKSVNGVYDSREAFETLYRLLLENKKYGIAEIEVTRREPPKDTKIHPDFKSQYEGYLRIHYGKKNR